MKIINKVDKDTLQAFGYEQWVEQFVENVINGSELKFDEVTIIDLDGKTIYLKIDGKDFDIRTWKFQPIKKDDNGHTRAEIVRYTLFETVWDGDGTGHGNEISEGEIRINWTN